MKGFLNMLFDFCGVGFACSSALFCLDIMLPGPLMGLPLRLHGWKSSLRSSTKFDGNSPTMRLSRFNRPIHHDPSPALRTSIRSPSIKPRSRFVCPPTISQGEVTDNSSYLNSPLRPMNKQLCTSTESALEAPALLPSPPNPSFIA